MCKSIRRPAEHNTGYEVTFNILRKRDPVLCKAFGGAVGEVFSHLQRSPIPITSIVFFILVVMLYFLPVATLQGPQICGTQIVHG